jgi:hypothetical protein
VIFTSGFCWTRAVPTVPVPAETVCVETFPRRCSGFMCATAAALSIASSDLTIVPTVVGFVCCEIRGVPPELYGVPR